MGKIEHIFGKKFMETNAQFVEYFLQLYEVDAEGCSLMARVAIHRGNQSEIPCQ